MSERRRKGTLWGWLVPRLEWEPPHGWPICGHCTRPLSLRRILLSWRQPKPLTYPFRKSDGTRQEMPVRWLCHGCIRRAEHHRAHEPIQPSG